MDRFFYGLDDMATESFVRDTVGLGMHQIPTTGFLALPSSKIPGINEK